MEEQGKLFKCRKGNRDSEKVGKHCYKRWIIIRGCKRERETEKGSTAKMKTYPT